MRQTRNLDTSIEQYHVSDPEPEKRFGEAGVQQRCDLGEKKGLELDPFSRFAKRPGKPQHKEKDGSSRDAQWRAFRCARGDLEARWLLRRGQF